MVFKTVRTQARKSFLLLAWLLAVSGGCSAYTVRTDKLSSSLIGEEPLPLTIAVQFQGLRESSGQNVASVEMESIVQDFTSGFLRALTNSRLFYQVVGPERAAHRTDLEATVTFRGEIREDPNLWSKAFLVGFTLFIPVYFGADPCVASKTAYFSPMFPPGAIPKPPTKPAHKSDRISP